MKKENKYIAFLRSINVGGHNIISMGDLKKLFIDLGYKHVHSFIQSGNVIFSSTETDTGKIANRIGRQLRKILGSDIVIIIRSSDEIAEVIKTDPFKHVPNDNLKLYVVLLDKIPAKVPPLPLISEKDGLEIISISGKDIFVLSRRVKNMYGFPNNFIEREFAVNSTSRNWNTIQKIYEKYIK